MPSKSLAGCFFDYIYRDTRGCGLSRSERVNRFPASPFCTVSWIFQGDVTILGRAGELPRLCFSGPQRDPIVSYNTGDIHAVTLGIYPESWAALTGCDVSDYIDVICPLSDVVSPALLKIFETLFANGYIEDQIAEFEKRLSGVWTDSRSSQTIVPYTLSDWLKALLAKSAMSPTGLSLRQLQRRIKHWTGQNKRELMAYSRVEDLFSEWLSMRETETPNLASLAAETGFSDQSHMGRDVKRLIGITPSRLNQLIDTDESFWFYRLMGERY